MLLSDVLEALEITGEAVTVTGAEETEDGWVAAVPGTVSVVFSDESAAVITLERLVELTENDVRAERSAQTVEDLISSGALSAEQALALGLVERIEAAEPTREAKGTRGLEAPQDTKGAKGAEPALETKGTREIKNTKGLFAAAVTPAVSTKTEAVVLDVQLTNDAVKTEDGQYLAPIRLSSPIKLVEAGCAIQSYSVQVYHIADGKATAVPVSDVVIRNGKLVSFVIETDGFSPYVVKYTVEFFLNGQMYTLPGYGQVLLSQLLNALNTGLSVSDITDVTFTDASLLEVKKIERDTTLYQLYLEHFGYDGGVSNDDAIIDGSGSMSFDRPVQAGDWVLTSLASFTEEHTLTILLQNGLTFYIKVTDPVSDPTNGIWYLDDSNTVASDHLKYSISSTITETVQERDVSFSLAVNYELTPAAFAEIKGYVNGYPKLVYDISGITTNAPVTISDTPVGQIRQGYTTVGEYSIVNGVVTITITNLAWLQEQNGLGGHFNITVNVDESQVNEEGTVEFNLPGIQNEITIHVKPLDYHPTKTVFYDGQNASEGVYLTEDNGYYYLHYTATLDNPKNANSIKFMDTLSGNQELVDSSVTIDGQSVSVTKPFTQGTTTYSFAADVPLQDGVVKQGTHTVQYTTRIEKSKVKQWTEANIDLEVNDSDWLVNDSSVIDGPETTVKPVRPTPAPTPAPTPVPMVLDKKVNDQDNLDSVQPGATLNYEITYGQTGTEMGDKVISDYMTDNQKLTSGSVQISYDGGVTWTSMPDAGGVWDGGVCYQDDNSYGMYNTDVFRYKLPANTLGPVKVRYSTTVITVPEAAANHLYGEQWIENTAKVDNMTDVTHAKVTFPDEPTVTKTANGVEDLDEVNPGTLINYRIEYGSSDIPLAGTSIQDAMTALQDLAGDGNITVRVGSDTFTVGSSNSYGSGSLTWIDLNGNYSENEQSVFNFTFRNDLDPSICGPVIVTYTAKVMDPIPNTMFGMKTFKNKVTVNNKSDETTGQIHTNEPETIAKVIKDESGNEITVATPGQTVTYVVTIGDPGKDMSGRKITDWMSGQQLLDTSTPITISDSHGHSDEIKQGEPGYNWNQYNTYNPWATYSVLSEYPVPNGWIGPLTLTYKTIIADETEGHNAGMWGVQHVKNHATTDMSGNADTDVPVDYGEPQKTHLEKTAENLTTTTGNYWMPGDRIKWTITFGDGTMDMRGKVLEDNMTFLQTLDMSDEKGVQVTVGGVRSTLPVVTSRYNSNDPGYYGVLYPLDDHVNQNNYSPYTTVPVFRYQVDPNAAEPIMGPVTFTYETVIIDQDTAWTLGINNVKLVNNHVWTDDNSDDEGHDTDFHNPPDPSATKTARTGATEAEAQANATLHVDGEAYALGSYIYYEMTYGNDYTNLNNYWISDYMTELQTLVGDVEYQITNDLQNIHPTEWIKIPVAPTAETGTPDGVKWGYEHTDGQYSNQNKTVFTFRLPADAGEGKLTVRYTARVMTQEEAQANSLYGTYTNYNNFYAGGTSCIVYGPVTVDEPTKDPQKTVSPIDVDDDPTTTDVDEGASGWKPGDELSYTLTYGYPGQWINNPSSLTNIYDSMTNMQKLQLDDTHHVTVTYYTEYYTAAELADSSVTKQTASFDMPVAYNGVRWTPRQDTAYSASMVDVFNYTFPKEDEQKPGAPDGTLMGRIYGPITVTYKTNIITVEEAQASFIWGTAAEPIKTVNNVFMNVADTPGHVTYPPEPTHDGKIYKSAYEKYNSTTGQYEPDYVNVTPELASTAGSRSTVIESEGKVIWRIRVDVDPSNNSTFPFENFDVREDYYYFSQITGENNANTSGSRGGTYESTHSVDDLFHIAEAVVTTDSGRVLTPGEDYTYNPATYKFHFTRIDEPITITYIAEFPYTLVGNYTMTNRVFLEYENKNPNAYSNVEGTIQKAVAKKTSTRESTNLIKWEVLLNPLKVNIGVNNDRNYVLFEDYLPEGLTVVNYTNHADTEHPSILVEDSTYNRRNVDREMEVEVVNNKITKEISSLREVPVYSKEDAETRSYDGYWYERNNSVLYKAEPIEDSSRTSGTILECTTGISGTWYKVTYYTIITDAEWDNIYSTISGSKDYLNRAFFTNGIKSYSAEATQTVKAPSPIIKGEYNGYEGDSNYSSLNDIVVGGGTHEGDIYYYKIEINPHQVQLVQEVNGKKLPIKLMDYIDPKIDTDPTYIRIRSINADGSEQYRLDAETHTNTFPDEIKPAVRYNDDTRMLTIENLQDQTHYSIEYPVRLRAQWASGEDEKEFKVTNTVTMQASGTWSATVTNTHKEQKVNAGFDVPLTLQKVDENDATVPLKDAVFEVYKLSTDPTTGLITDWPGTKINKAGESDNSASFTSDNDGKVVFSINTFQEETLYYWKEIEAPTGYLLVDTPHYFIVYKEDSNGNTSRMKAWAMDNLCTAANGITIASISQGTTWMVTNSKTRSIMVTKRWNADYDNIYKTRPESVTVNLIRIDYLGNRTQIDSVVLYPAADGNWQAYTNYIWNNLPAHEEDHPERPYTYTVEEEYVKNYVAVYSDNQEGVTNGGITITNRLIPSKTNIYLEKKWNNAETADLPDHITVTLQQIHKDADGNVGAPAPATTIPGYVVTLTPDSEGHWTYEWTNLPTRDGQGGEYTYTVKETVPEGFTVTYSDDNRGVLESTSANPLVITNTAVGSLKVTKSFTGFTPGSLTQAQKEAIHFTVKNIAEETVAQFTYADMLGGEKTIENLPAGIYTVTETRAEGSDPADYVWQEATYTVNGTPSGNGEVTVVINQTATVGVTNTPQDGGLRITKSVTINGNEPNGSDLADGTYTFVIKKNGTPINEGMVGTTAVVDGEVAITISGGVAQTVDVTGLTPGIYTITESTPTNGTTLTAASGGNSVDANNVVTVTVTAGAFASSVGTTTVVQPVDMVANHATSPEASA